MSANSWIESLWMGKQVKQERGSDDCIGRAGTVVETLWDENGAMHCKVQGTPDDRWFWCPVFFLEIVS